MINIRLVRCSKPLGASNVDSVFHPSKVDKMSIRNFWKLSGKFMFQHSNVFLFFNAGNKIFCFFKKWVLLFWMRVHFKGVGSQVPQNFEAWLLIKEGGGGFYRFRIVFRRLGKKGWGQYFRVGLIPWRTLWKGKTDTHRFLPQVVQVGLWTLAWKRWTAR